MTTSTDKIIVGRVSGAHGILGWVKVQSFTEPLEQLFDYPYLQIEYQGQWRAIEIEDIKPLNTGFLVKFNDCGDRTTAEQLRGALLAVSRADLPVLSNDEYYWVDLEGLTVMNQQQIVLGKVVSLLETGANDVLVVQDASRQRLIPYVKGHTVQQVDLEKKMIIVDWDEAD